MDRRLPKTPPPPELARSAPVHGSRLRTWTVALLVAVVGLFGANSLNYVTPLRPGPDAGAFASVAMQTMEGKVLYKDTIVAKPPMVFALNAVALSIGGRTFQSIRVLERLWAIFAVVLVFFIVLITFRRRSLATLAAVAYSFYSYGDRLFEQGNVTEEYALVFVLAGILCALRASPQHGSSILALCVGSGACFALAALTKEPFVLSSVPWFLFLVLGPRDGSRAAVRRAMHFVLGAFIPVCTFLGYLNINDAFSAWVDEVFGAVSFIGSLDPERTFLHRLKSGGGALGSVVLLTTDTGRLAFAVGVIAALVLPAFTARYRYIPCVALLAVVMDLLERRRWNPPAVYGQRFSSTHVKVAIYVPCE